MTDAIYSSAEELMRIASIIECCARLPISNDAVPGAFLETVFGHVRRAKVLATYDYVDVIDKNAKLGWSIKSTKEDTPMTWKRAKLPNKVQMIAASKVSKEAVQVLGDALITFCNDHAKASLMKYDLSAIGFCRLIIRSNRQATYFERILCTSQLPYMFNPADFEWDWSVEKTTKLKEQLSALHGWHKPTGKRWWAWHGLGENQLHFKGEQEWWPLDNHHAITFTLPDPDAKLTFETLLELLNAA